MATIGNDKQAYYEAWAQMMVSIWQDKIISLGVRDTGELLASFEKETVIQSNGDIGKIVFSYLYYGRMRDMGVGRGVPMGEVEGSNRRPAPWYNKAFFRSVKVLTEKMAELYGEQFQNIIHETLTF